MRRLRRCDENWRARVVDESKPWMLALDTSNTLVSLAIGPVGNDASAPGAEIVWNAGRHQTTTILAQVDGLMRLAGIDPGQLGAVAVASGPGAFNALRVGMSIGKGFAFSMQIPIFGVGTLDIAAHTVAYAGRPVRAFVEAGRGRVVVGDYSSSNGRLQLRGALEHRTPDQLGDGLLEPTVLSGELGDADRQRLASTPNVILPPASSSRRRAAALLDIAAPRWRNGEADDLLALEPMYIHSQPVQAATPERNS